MDKKIINITNMNQTKKLTDEVWFPVDEQLFLDREIKSVTDWNQTKNLQDTLTEKNIKLLYVIQRIENRNILNTVKQV